MQEGEIPDLLNIIFNHRKAALQGFLRDRRQAFSGTQEKLRKRVEGYLSDGSVRAEELVELWTGSRAGATSTSTCTGLTC